MRIMSDRRFCYRRSIMAYQGPRVMYHARPFTSAKFMSLIRRLEFLEVAL